MGVRVASSSLLTPADPAPVELVNGESDAPVLLLCEHAGNEVPAALGDLGISEEILASHRGYDIGAESVARALADMLKAPLILQRYSRLVIDANRPPSSAQSILEVSDGAHIPGNRDLAAAHRQARVSEIFEPMDKAIQDGFASHERRAAISIHSFTPQLGDECRPWHAGFLSRRSLVTAEHLMASVTGQAPDLKLALNKPYQIEDATDWFIPRHAEPRALPHCLIEIRNDQIRTGEQATRWASMLAEAIHKLPETWP